MIVFAVVGIGLLVAGTRELVRRLRSVGRFERAEGVVVGVKSKETSISSDDSSPSIMHFPTITFSRRTGQTETFTSEVGDGGAVSRYKVGQRLWVRYDPAREFGPMLDSWWGIWFPNIMIVVSGVLFVFGACLIYWAFWDRIVGSLHRGQN